MNDSTAPNPGRLLSLSGGYWQPCVLHCAVKLKIFSLLTEPRTVEETAELAGCSSRGTGLLLHALAAMGLLEKAGDRFENTAEANQYLDQASPDYIGHMIMHHHHLVDGWAQLDRAVVSGRPVDKRSPGEEMERESFLYGMDVLARQVAPRIASLVDLKNHRRLLDIGGGAGTHAIHFCLANPHLAATVFDRPTTEPYTRATVERYGLTHRIGFVGGDFLSDPLPEGHDVAWLSQVLHSNDEEACRTLLNRVLELLPPGGIILIHEFFLDDTMTSPLFPALFSLNMLIGNLGRSYSEKEIREMLDEAGAEEVVRLPFQGPNDSAILMGRKPSR